MNNQHPQPCAATSTTACDTPCTGQIPPRGPRIAEICDNLTARIAEAEREGRLGEAEGLNISLAGAEDKLAQIDRRTRPAATDLGIPAPARQP